MKKILSIILIVVLILAVIPIGTVFAATSTSGKTGDCTWTLNGTKLTISGHGIMNNYSSSNTSPWGKEITEAVIEEGVTNIGDYAFYQCENLQRVTTFTATSIGTYAFAGCNRLTDIIVPDSITSIGNSAFIDCNNLSYNQYDNALYLGNIKNPYTVLVKCINTAITTCKINDNSRIIYQNAFFNCSNLKDVIIPDNILCIGNHAFAGCSGIDTINIPDSVTTLGSYAFSGCSSAETLYIGSSLITLPTYVFQNCTGLTTVTVPNNITTIQEFAFAGCNSITNITLPFVGESRTATGYSSAFGYIFGYNTTGSSGSTGYYRSGAPKRGDICSVDGKYSRYIKSWNGRESEYTVFYSQQYYYNTPSSIKTVIITDATCIPGGSFNYCQYITTIVLNDMITSIGAYAFCNDIGIKDFEFPNCVTNIGDYAFKNCTGLTNIEIPNGVKSIGDGSFINCTGLSSIQIPDSVTDIGSSAFKNCTGLSNIKISNKITEIHVCTFEGCTGLTSVSLPNGITTINEYAFKDCIGLREVTIPDSVTLISDAVFSGCSSLESISLPFVGRKRITPSDTFQYPLGFIFGEYSFSGATEVRQSYHHGNLSNDYLSKYYIPSSLKFITITDSTYIPYHAFQGCNMIKEISITKKVISIADGAFDRCSVRSITLPDSIVSIGRDAFYNCSSLTEIYYIGTEEQWEMLDNKPSGTVYFGCKDHVYDNKCDTTCNICGATRTITHQYKTVWSKDGAQHWHECSICGSKKDIENHTYDNACDTACNVCGYIRSVGPHVYDNDCDTTCNICGATRTITHQYKTVWSNDGTQHWHECSVCGDKIDIENHIYDNACDTTCNICGYIRSVGPHVYDNDCDTTCNICGATRTITHQYKTVWSNDGTQHWHECSVCSAKIDIGNHNFDKDGVCNTCGYISFVAGDLDGVEGITDADAVYLLMYTFFPEDYPVDQPVDYNGDGFVTDADAIYLLMYTFFPEDYPI